MEEHTFVRSRRWARWAVPVTALCAVLATGCIGVAPDAKVEAGRSVRLVLHNSFDTVNGSSSSGRPGSVPILARPGDIEGSYKAAAPKGSLVGVKVEAAVRRSQCPVGSYCTLVTTHYPVEFRLERAGPGAAMSYSALWNVPSDVCGTVRGQVQYVQVVASWSNGTAERVALPVASGVRC